MWNIIVMSADAPNYKLDMLHTLQKQVWGAIIGYFQLATPIFECWLFKISMIALHSTTDIYFI